MNWANSFDLVKPYLPSFVNIQNVFLFSKDDKPDSCCKWRVYIKDNRNNDTPKQLKSSLNQYLNINKPRNSINASLEYVNGKRFRYFVNRIMKIVLICFRKYVVC